MRTSRRSVSPTAQAYRHNGLVSRKKDPVAVGEVPIRDAGSNSQKPYNPRRALNQKIVF